MDIVKVAKVLRPKTGNMWGVYGHTYTEVDHICLINAKLVIDPIKQQRDMKLGTKGLHAWIEGIHVRADYPIPLPCEAWQRIIYELSVSYFYYWDTDRKLQYLASGTTFSYAICNREGQLWVYV